MDVFTEMDIVLEAIGAMLTPRPPLASAAASMAREAHRSTTALPVPRQIVSEPESLAPAMTQCAELPTGH